MAQRYNLPDIYKGDTFEKVQFTILVDGTALDLTGASIKSVFKKDKKQGSLIKTIEIGTGITVTDATNGIFEFDAFDLDWDAGTYYYDIEITDNSSVILTYVIGVINVILDV